MSLSFEEASARVAGLSRRGWRLDLDRIHALIKAARLTDALGKPPGPKYIQVAGTNGKGSVTAMIQAMLIGQGHKTGGFFSPYVYDPRERIQIGGEYIPKQLFAQLTDRLWPAAESLESTEFEGPTEFEFKTALGIAAWLEAGCEWVALEVGVGGRLDATSVVTPECGVIVSIGRDHTAILGDTLGKIAWEKAGILKPGMKCVVGNLAPDALEAVERKAKEAGASLWRIGSEVHILRQREDEFQVQTPEGTFDGLSLSLEGEHQAHNAALAIAAMVFSGAVRDPSLLAASLQKVRPPGRLEHRLIEGVEFLLDGAHNVEAARSIVPAVRKHLSRTGRKLVMISAMLDGHDPAEFYNEFAEFSPSVFVPPINFFRSREPESLAKEISRALPLADVEASSSVESAIQAALTAAGEGGLILVTGSFYLVGEVGNALSDGRCSMNNLR